MDIEFIVQDVFALTRPQWKLASNLEEASRAFQLAMQQDQKTAGLDKVVEPEEPDSDGSSDDGIGEGEAESGTAEVDEGSAESDDEMDADANGDNLLSAHGTDSEEEAIVVTRQEEQIDPEDEADFEREYAKMMAESLESRKFERKATFDVPLPMKRKDREVPTAGGENWADETTTTTTTTTTNAPPSNTMAFSLLTKRGNRQQVCFENVSGSRANANMALDSYR